MNFGADGSVVERVPDKNKVDGSIPSRPTWVERSPKATGARFDSLNAH